VTDVLSGLDAAQRARVDALRAQGRFFWIDASLREATHDELVEALAIPEGALRALPGSGEASASRTFHADGQSVAFTLRCYVDAQAPTEDASFRLRPLEVRVVITGDYLATLHVERISLPAVLALDLPEQANRPHAVYAVLVAMLETTFAALDEVAQGLEGLEVTWAEGRGGGASRPALRATGTKLASMRRWVTAEQAVFERLGVEIGTLRGFQTDSGPYFDRLDEQVERLSASIDAAGDAIGMLLDLQLNERAYVVSIVATIFVPLTFVTGFFGMNFGWMIDHIDSPIAFWLLGIVIPIVTAAAAWRLFLRQILMGDDPEARSR
jgi:magnesium transporter